MTSQRVSDQVSFTRLRGTDVVRLSGEIDIGNAHGIGREIVSCVPATGPVLLDLTAVSFLDSAGVRLLDALIGDMDDHGTSVRLIVGESGPARMTLQLCAFRDDLLATDLDRAAEELGL